MSAFLEVKHLHKNFGDFVAVQDLSFTVEKQDVYGFLGQNGAGKSTTLRMLLSLIKPTAGEMLFNGKNILTHRAEFLQQTGAVIEKPDLYKYLSAYDNLSIFARMSGIKVTRSFIMERLAMVGLQDRSKSKVKTYSQGMKQRLGIAVAMVHDPALLILDEPTNGLDPQGIADIRHLIQQLSREMNKTVIVSSHLLYEIEQVASRMIIINKGKKIVEGSVAKLLDPSKTIVEIQTNNNSAAAVIIQEQQIEGIVQSEESLKIEMHKEDIPALIASLSVAGIDIQAVVPRHSLEDYFINLTNAENNVESIADRTV
jgi:ABC-type multidrug transport system ATPase subunit